MLQKPDVLEVDIEGVILPKDPEKGSPSALRIDFIKNMIEEFRAERGYKPLSQFLIKPTDFLWEKFHMDLGSVLNKLLEQAYTLHHPFKEQEANEIKSLIPIAKKIIKESTDYYLELAEKQKIKYETNPGIVELLRQIKKELNIPFRIVSGNPKLVAEDKLRRAGVLDLFLDKKGELPDLPIYGEDVMSRSESIDLIDLELFKANPSLDSPTPKHLYLVDRESDLNTAYYSSVNNDVSFILFGKNPLKTTFKYQGFDHAPLAVGYLQKFITSDRILFMPKGLKTPHDIEMAMEFVRGPSNIRREKAI